jgi:hypothetical protein
MQDDNGDMRLICGTLVQDEITLDPYLLIRRGGLCGEPLDEIVIGIWDGGKVLHIATDPQARLARFGVNTPL